QPSRLDVPIGQRQARRSRRDQARCGEPRCSPRARASMSATLGGMTSQRTPVNHESAEGAQEQTVRRLPAGATDLTLENTVWAASSVAAGSRPERSFVRFKLRRPVQYRAGTHVAGVEEQEPRLEAGSRTGGG